MDCLRNISVNTLHKGDTEDNNNNNNNNNNNIICKRKKVTLFENGTNKTRQPGGRNSIQINPLNAELNPICHLLALLGAHLIFHVSRIRVKFREELLPSSQNILSSYLQSKNKKVKICRTKIISVVVDGCGTWFLTLKEGHKLRNFESGLMRKIFASTRREVTGDSRKLCNEELLLLLSSPDLILVLKSRSLGQIER